MTYVHLDAIPHLLNRIIPATDFGLEDTIDEKTILEVILLLEYGVRRLQIVVAANPVILLLLEDCCGVWHCHRLGVFRL